MKKIFKKLLIFEVIIFSSLTSYGFSETYTCSYNFEGKGNPVQFIRQNKLFREYSKYRNNTFHKILFEDNRNLILGVVTYIERNDKDDRKGLQVTFIDKISMMFTSGVISNPNYGKNSSIVKGTCLLIN